MTTTNSIRENPSSFPLSSLLISGNRPELCIRLNKLMFFIVYLEN
ncbi:hypothetical protein EW15_1642 [Prochlorococcus sp. MIT 0801]|nr:hypothetical protein EW15_1642 [Prochlorococcus sp. MIT 0801]